MAAATMSMCSRNKQKKQDGERSSSSSGSQQEETCYSYNAMDQFWNEIAAADAAAASYYMVDGWGGAGHSPAAEVPAAMPSSPVWEYYSDYSLWRIDDEEYYKKMLDAS
ncbi:unnamed protein product [Urochloa humidicola]